MFPQGFVKIRVIRGKKEPTNQGTRHPKISVFSVPSVVQSLHSYAIADGSLIHRERCERLAAPYFLLEIHARHSGSDSCEHFPGDGVGFLS